MKLESPKITRSIEERRSVTFDLTPRILEAPRGTSRFMMTGIRVSEYISSKHPERSGTTAWLTGRKVKADGTPSLARGADDEPRIALHWVDGGYGLRWHVAPEHWDHIVELAEQALEGYGMIDWEQVEA